MMITLEQLYSWCHFYCHHYQCCHYYNDNHYDYSAQTKHKSRSLVNLLPSTLRRYISKESLSQTTFSSSPNSPDVHHSREPSKETTPIDASGSNFHRQYSARPSQEMSVKGIRFTERSRSFRKPKSSQRSKSAEPVHRAHVDESIVASADDHSPRCSRAEAERGASSPGDAASSTGGQNRDSGGTSGPSRQCDSDSKTSSAFLNGVPPLPKSPKLEVQLPGHTLSKSNC